MPEERGRCLKHQLYELSLIFLKGGAQNHPDIPPDTETPKEGLWRARQVRFGQVH